LSRPAPIYTLLTPGVQYISRITGVKLADKDEDENDDEEDIDVDDIEASIMKEVNSLKQRTKPQNDSERPLVAFKLNVDCLLFVRTKGVDPLDLVKRICEDASKCTDPRDIRCRYLNRFSPSVVIGKANESGIIELSKKVLAPYFDLSGKRANPETTTKPAAVLDSTDQGVSSEGNPATAGNGDVNEAKASSVAPTGSPEQGIPGPDLPAACTVCSGPVYNPGLLVRTDANNLQVRHPPVCTKS
jgi:tRNA acetyltransferase TAN1